MPFVSPCRVAGPAVTVLFVFWGLFAAGCGSVGEPLPPLLNIPERSQDLSAVQNPEGIVLEWTWPEKTTEGMPLKDLESFFIHAIELTASVEPPHHDIFELNGRRVATIDTAELSDTGAVRAPAQGPTQAPGQGQGGRSGIGPGERVRHVLDIAGLEGKTWALGVRGESSRGRSIGFSNLTAIELVSPPGAPGTPEIAVETDAVVLTWDAADGADFYRILRGVREPQAFDPIGDTDHLSFRDTTFEWSRHYLYRVQSLARSRTGEALGPISEPTSVFTADTFPPVAPVRVQAIPTPTSVELSWQPSPGPDLAGYLVSRVTAESPPVTLTDDLLTTPAYSDPTAHPGQTYRYTIRAVDQDGNASPPSDEVSVTVP